MDRFSKSNLEDVLSADTTLSFSSPDSHFTAAAAATSATAAPPSSESQMEDDHSYTLSFASPESDFTGLPLTPTQQQQLSDVANESSDELDDYSNTLSFASPESDFSGLPLTSIQKQQLNKLIVNEMAPHSTPITMDSALASTGEAKVLTSPVAPFNIQHVNDEWMSLCGFSAEESIGKDLGILQGPLTDEAVLSDLRNAIKKGDYVNAQISLTNYNKNGESFGNNLSVTPVVEDDGEKIVALLGILRPVQLSNQSLG